MEKVRNLKNVKMAVALALMILLVATLIPAPVQAAEATWYKGTPGYDQTEKVKIGEGYFWYEYSEDASVRFLYYAAKKSGKGVKIASQSGEYKFGDTILFNGTKVYYTSDNYASGADPSKVKIHSVSKTGKNKVTLRTITAKDRCGYSKLLSVYNGKVYFTCYDKDWDNIVTAGKLYSIGMKKDAKSGKYLVSTVNKDFPGADSRGADSRYIYAQPTYDTVKIFDCKSRTVIRTLQDASDFYIGSKYLYFKDYDKNDTPVLMRTSLTGKNKTVVKKLPNSSYATIRKTGKMYYNEYNEAGEAKFYEYNLSKKTTVEISESEFMMKAFDGTFGM